MKKIILFLICLLFLTSLVSAEITGEIYKIIQNNNGTFDQQVSDNLLIKYYLSDGGVINVPVDSSGNYQLSFNGVYCWNDCNIYPTIFVDKIEAIENSKLISYLNDPVASDIPEKRLNYHLTNLILTDFTANNTEPQNYSNNIIDNNLIMEEPINFSGSYTLINWTGLIHVNQSKYYSFKLDIDGQVKVIINGEKILDTFNEPNPNQFSYFLNEGFSNLSIVYYVINNNPNLLWNESGEFEPVSKNNLIFLEGGSKKVSSVKRLMLASSSYGPYYPDTVDYSYTLKQDVNSITSSRNPLLLIHGLTGSYPYWNDIPSDFVSDGHDVWEFYYSPADLRVERGGVLLEDGLKRILVSYPNKKADLVVHSMGGLISRTYINDLSKNSLGQTVTYKNNVRSLVMIGTPNYGSHLANLCFSGFTSLICQVLNKNYPANIDLSVGSQNTWDNYKAGLRSGINYLVIAGTSNDLGLVNFVTENAEVSDSVVAASSASLLNLNVPLFLIQANHNNEHGKCVTAFGYRCHLGWGGWYYDDTMSNLISGFLKGDSTSTLKSKLYTGEYYVSNGDPNSDATPYSQGSILIKLTGKNPSSVKLKSMTIDSSDYGLEKNVDTGIWFHFGSNSVGLTMPSGNYHLIADNSDTGKDITISPLQTNVYEIDLSNTNTKTCQYGICCTNGFILPYGSAPNNPAGYPDQLPRCDGQDIKVLHFYCNGVNATMPDRTLIINQTCSNKQQCIDDGSWHPYCKDICTPNIINTAWSDWTNWSCATNDKMNQTRSRIQYDSNNCGTISNQTIYDYQLNGSCDYCTPNWVNVFSCNENGSQVILAKDFYNCFNQTGLSKDLLGKPENNKTYPFSCDYYRNGIIGKSKDLNTNSKNISVLINGSSNILKNFTGIQKVEIMEGNKKLLEFNFTFNSYDNPVDTIRLSLVKFLNEKTNGGVEYVSYSDLGNLYEIIVTYQNQTISTYVTKDGKYYIQGAIPLDINNSNDIGSTLSGDIASKQLVDFLNTETNGGVEYVSYSNKGYLYETNVTYINQTFSVYVSVDGRYFIQGIEPIVFHKSDKPNVELFVMSYCPYGTQAEKGIIPAVENLGNKINFSIRFVHYFMHGDKEETETYNQVCIREEQPDKYLSYVKCFLNDGNNSRCLSVAGINITKLNICLTNNKSKEYYAVDSNLSQQYGVQGSPTLIINGVEVYSDRNPNAFLESICSKFNVEPLECFNNLSTQNPSAGFGNSSSSSGGGCATASADSNSIPATSPGSNSGGGGGGYLYRLNLGNLTILKEDNSTNFGFILIKGLDLSSQNQTKIVYVDKILNGTGLCIKDSEIDLLTEISDTCTSSDETWLKCPDSKNGYICELIENDTRYKISGLKHSGIKEQATYCGDGISNGGETCSSCSADVGACPSNDGGGSGGGGGGGGEGGGGGGSSSSTTKASSTTPKITTPPTNNNPTTTQTNEVAPTEDKTSTTQPTLFSGIGDFFRNLLRFRNPAVTGAKEGDSNPVIVYVVLLAILLAGIILFVHKLYKRRNKSKGPNKYVIIKPKVPI